MWDRGYFRQDLFKKCLLCKTENNDIKHVIIEFEK